MCLVQGHNTLIRVNKALLPPNPCLKLSTLLNYNLVSVLWSMYLVSVFALDTRTFIIGALFDLLSIPVLVESVVPLVTLSKSLLLYGATWLWIGVELIFAADRGGSTSILILICHHFDFECLVCKMNKNMLQVHRLECKSSTHFCGSEHVPAYIQHR